MSRHRIIETANERELRLEEAAQKKRTQTTKDDEAMDEMVKQSIKKHGP
jgi:hypothetical protein